MKITIELPDTTMCVFANYMFIDDNGAVSMGVKSLCTDDLLEFRFTDAKTKVFPKFTAKDGDDNDN